MMSHARTPAGLVLCLLLVVLAPPSAPARAASDVPLIDSERGRNMVYGPYLSHSLAFGRVQNSNQPIHENAVPRALIVALPGNLAICYDTDRLAVAGVWRHLGDGPNSFIDLGRTHHQSHKGGSPALAAGEVLYQRLNAAGWAAVDVDKPDADAAVFDGHYLHGSRVALAYTVRGRQVIESPDAAGGEGAAVVRHFQVGPGKEALRLHVAELGHDGQGGAPHAKLAGDDGVKLATEGDVLTVIVPPADKPVVFAVTVSFGREAAAASSADPGKMTRGGPRRWAQTVTTQGAPSTDKQAYVLDDLPVPHRNPWGCWMRLSAIDFLSDGTAAVATLSGDVWLVSWPGDDIAAVTWRRFATGLYEPLGLKVVDDRIYVRGRDRITRLVDVNADGEADFYENFHSAGDIGTSYHAFLFDLVTDRAGNFYFARSGRKAPPPGDVVRVSPDGKRREVIATHFRHPNGMGGAGLHDWILIADNPGGKYPSGAMIVQQGASYGESNGPRTAPFLYVLPPDVDTSSGSQCWTDPKRFGPLSSTLIHTSYSKSTACYVMVQAFDGQGTVPNGFAVKWPFRFSSGVMRCAVSPRDGQVYLIGQRGWDTNAATDGCLQRIRYTGRPAYVVESAAAVAVAGDDPAGVRLRFACPLDASTVNADGFAAMRVDQRGKRYIDVAAVKLLDERTVLVRVDGLDTEELIDRDRTKKDPDGRTHYRVVPPLGIIFDIKAKDGTEVRDTVYATVNTLAENP